MLIPPSTFLPKRDKNVPYIAEVQSIPLSPSAYSVIIKDKSIFETSLSPNGSVSMSSFLTSIFDSAYIASLKYKSDDNYKYIGIPLLNAFVKWQIEEIDDGLDDKSKEIIKSYLISISLESSSISGITSTEANEVWRLPAASKGDTRTSL